MRSPIAWMAKDKVTPNLLMLLLIFGGLLVSWNIKKEINPEFDLDEGLKAVNAVKTNYKTPGKE